MIHAPAGPARNIKSAAARRRRRSDAPQKSVHLRHREERSDVAIHLKHKYIRRDLVAAHPIHRTMDAVLEFGILLVSQQRGIVRHRATQGLDPFTLITVEI